MFQKLIGIIKQNCGSKLMIIYKREMTLGDIANLDEDEELIYYMTDNIAITINKSNNRYIVRKKQISDNELIDEAFLNTIDEIMNFIEL